MIDPVYAFLAFAALLVLETLAAQGWAAPYFRLGIPVFFIRASMDGPLDAARAAQALDERFKATPLHPSIRFRALGPGQIAQREVLFENRGGIRYIPVMHALARLHPDRRLLTLTGSLNWSILAALAYVLYRSLNDRSFIPVALLILFIIGLSYAVQSALLRRIARSLQELARQGSPPQEVIRPGG